MGDQLDKRGQPVEVLFGFLDEPARKLALLLPTFLTKVRLEADARGIVRTRIQGLPSALVPIADDLYLDVSGFAARWPHWVSELTARAGDATARSLLARKPVLEVSPAPDALKDLILAHEIRAEHLYLLGDALELHAAPSGDDELAYAIELPRGTLELAIPRPTFARAIETRAPRPAPDIRIRWQGTRIELPTDELAWHDDELAELAMIVTMHLAQGGTDAILRLLDAALPDGGARLTPSLPLGAVLSLWGVALRKAGQLPRAIATLERVHAFAKALDPQLEQQVSYNLGYAKLETTMQARTALHREAGNELVSAAYTMDEKHRALWLECRTLFERALELDPDDATARSQVDQVNKLLAVLDLNQKSSPSRTPPSRAPRTTTKPEFDLRPVAVISIILVLALVVLVKLRHHDDASPPPAPPSAAPTPAPVPDRDAPRQAALAALHSGALPAGNGRPCPVKVAVPTAVPEGTVVAPHLDRAIGTGELYGTDYFDATIRQWARQYASGLDVRPADPNGIGPIHGAAGPAAWRLPSSTPITLIVSQWNDPVITKDGAQRGHVAGHALVWSDTDRRFVCIGSFEADNAATLNVVTSADFMARQDDPLNRARLDLIEQAARAAIPHLEAIAP